MPGLVHHPRVRDAQIKCIYSSGAPALPARRLPDGSEATLSAHYSPL